MHRYPEPERVLPHRLPILLVDALLSMGDTHGLAQKTFREGDYGAEGGFVIEGALIECLAQTVAAIHGLKAFNQGCAVAPGMLVGVEDFAIFSRAVVGRSIEMAVEITRRLGPFCLADGVIRQESKTIAQGCLKFYIEGETGDAQETTSS
jgi:predicted hotdog family 3-hydroxylacyl-ACP dehydratase